MAASRLGVPGNRPVAVSSLKSCRARPGPEGRQSQVLARRRRDGARAVGATVVAQLPGRRSIARAVARSGWGLSNSPYSLPPRARERDERRFQRALTQTDLLEPAGRCSGCWPHDGEVDGCAVEIFVLVKSVWGDDGTRAIGMMMRPLRRRRLTAISYGIIDNRSENLQH